MTENSVCKTVVNGGMKKVTSERPMTSQSRPQRIREDIPGSL